MTPDWTETLLPHVIEVIVVVMAIAAGLINWWVSRATIKRTKAEVLKLSTEVENLKGEALLAANKAGRDAANEVFDRQIKQVDALRADVEYAERRNTDLEVRLREALERLDKNEEVLRTTKSELKEAAAHAESSTARIVQLEADLKILRDEICELRKSSAERIAELVAENTILRKELSDIRKQYKEAQVEIEDLQKELHALKSVGVGG